jgi:2-iminobutanoate/2-iminopropanoate deaminase
MQPITRSNSNDAPAPYGPYVHAVVVGHWIFLSGQNGRDPATLKLVAGGIQAQAERAIRNIKAVLLDLGSDLSHVLKTTVYLSDMRDFEAMNEIYQALFDTRLPARSTIEVRLPFRTLIAVDAIATRAL